MAACCQSPMVQAVEGRGLRLVAIRCRDRLCPLCAHRRAREVAQRYGEAVARMGAARHLVLTAPRSDAPLADQLRELRGCVKRLRQQEHWARHVTGGVYTIEITRSAESGHWHPHLHLIIDGSFFPQPLIRDAWRRALRSSTLWASVGEREAVIVHISAVHNRHQLARYIAKYIAKPASIGDWPAEAVVEYAQAVKGVRMMHAFGSLHGVKLAPEDPNPDPAKAETLCGLAEMDWRARQGWEEALRAVALVRRLWPRCSSWLGTERSAPLDAWAAEEPDPEGRLLVLCQAIRRMPPCDGPPPPPRRKPDRGPLLFHGPG